MALEVSLAQFNKIASGKYNVGFVDFKSDEGGNAVGELRKVNNHVHSLDRNTETISPERVLEIKESFVAGEGTAVLHDFEPPRKGVVVSFR